MTYTAPFVNIQRKLCLINGIIICSGERKLYSILIFQNHIQAGSCQPALLYSRSKELIFKNPIYLETFFQLLLYDFGLLICPLNISYTFRSVLIKAYLSKIFPWASGKFQTISQYLHAVNLSQNEQKRRKVLLTFW